MRVAVCDDDIREQEQLELALRDWDPARSAEKFFDGASLIAAARKSPPFDIVFLDVYIPGENGIDIARELKKTSPETEIVFVTASRDCAVEAFSIDALHYLVKPVTTQGVIEAFRRLTALRIRQQETLTLSVGRDIYNIHLSQICALESVNHAIEVSLNDGRLLRVWMPLNELEKKLNQSFLKINRGTIINLEYVEQISMDICTLRGGKRFFIPRRERAAIQTAYQDYVFNDRARWKGETGL